MSGALDDIEFSEADIARMGRPRAVKVSAWTVAELREQARKLGPRHRVIDRWVFDLGWTIDPKVVDDFLAPELSR